MLKRFMTAELIETFFANDPQKVRDSSRSRWQAAGEPLASRKKRVILRANILVYNELEA